MAEAIVLGKGSASCYVVHVHKGPLADNYTSMVAQWKWIAADGGFGSSLIHICFNFLVCSGDCVKLGQDRLIPRLKNRSWCPLCAHAAKLHHVMAHVYTYLHSLMSLH